MTFTQNLKDKTITVDTDGSQTVYTTKLDFEKAYPNREDWIALEDGYTLKQAAPIVIPQSITKLQAMRVLKQNGLWDTFKTILNDPANIDALEEWELSPILKRNNQFTLSLAPALGLTETDLDDLFNVGSTL